MTKYREYIGWGAIILATLQFLPVPLPSLPPMLSTPMFMLVPGLGSVLMMLHPMLLFAAGIGLVKGLEGGKKLFAAWCVVAVPAALAMLQYNPVFAAVDLLIIAGCLAVIFWGRWRSN